MNETDRAVYTHTNFALYVVGGGLLALAVVLFINLNKDVRCTIESLPQPDVHISLSKADAAPAGTCVTITAAGVEQRKCFEQ